MRVAIVTSTRADFGILLPLIQELVADLFFQTTLLVTGSHTDSVRGSTLQEIESEGVKDFVVVDIDTSDTTEIGVAKSAAETVGKFAVVLGKLHPDLVILLGDRYEILSVAMSAFLLKIPVAHISGGDLTAGALDDSIRHSITKLSHIHFPTTEKYRERVIQLGEQPNKVFNVGNLCIDNVKKISPLSKVELETFLSFDLNAFEKNILVTLHPETTCNNQLVLNDIFFDTLLRLDNVGIIITYPNHDAGGDSIINKILKIQSKKTHAICVCESLGMRRYHSLLRYVDAVVGNSSSGITEVPSYGIPTVDIGHRQQGRIRADSVINVDYKAEDIMCALTLALSDDFQRKCKEVTNPYGEGNSAEKILNILKKIELKGLIKKEFYDAK
ncbi:UDP-N-acetylglucosamine 2-epimerase [Vibrio mimicus]|uniref:UDP-N-acetylglucosamine 2-epimerase n=1 Tax=Vibrio mimicus TaxID=674 RepID=UPI0001BAD535|nr:UDP-N-acetylglucosamine 2-epimerase [Vibrio mimicus]EEY39728.1 UDP-N-acetylglucosamine 2-epimerase [Vibrio mimicus MB451]